MLDSTRLEKFRWFSRRGGLKTVAVNFNDYLAMTAMEDVTVTHMLASKNPRELSQLRHQLKQEISDYNATYLHLMKLHKSIAEFE